MARIVLTADYTLMSDFRELPLATFFSCIPTDFALSRAAFHVLAPNPPHRDGVALRAPYGLRKVEAGLLRRYRREEVVVAHPEHVHRFLDDDTEFVGIYTMDPLGFGPVSMSFTYGGRLTPYTKWAFRDLLRRVNGRRRRYRIVVGGPGVWHFDIRPEAREALGIDHIVAGEADGRCLDLVDEILTGDAPPVVRITNHDAPRLEEIPPIVGAAMHGMAEIMRGCGRGCEFCEVTLRRPRYMPLDLIRREVEVNARSGLGNAHLHSDDIFLYRVENWRTFEPNREAVEAVFRTAMEVGGIRSASATHGTVSAAVADPDLIANLTAIVRGGPGNWTGIQCGLETGSRELAGKIMPRKALPFRAEEWPDVILQGTEILNRHYWFPAYTLIVGLPGETPEDAWDTLDLLWRMERLPGAHFIVAPLTFVPIGILRGEQFFDIDSMIDEARFNVVYHAWRHILREMDANLWRFARMALPVRLAVEALGLVGGRLILRHIERYANHRGFRIRRPPSS